MLETAYRDCGIFSACSWCTTVVHHCTCSSWLPMLCSSAMQHMYVVAGRLGGWVGGWVGGWIGLGVRWGPKLVTNMFSKIVDLWDALATGFSPS